MGEAKRRKISDPKYGNTRKEEYKKDSLGLPTIRYFKVEDYDGEHYELSDPSMEILRPWVLGTKVWVECEKPLKVGTEVKGFLKNYNYGDFKIAQFVVEEVSTDCLQEKHVMAKDLSHIGIKGSVHLWHSVDNVWKSLTNTAVLEIVEKQKGFELKSLVQELAQIYNFRKGNYCYFPDGFIYIDHMTEKGDFIASDGWSTKVENILLMKGYLEYKAPHPNSQ